MATDLRDILSKEVAGIPVWVLVVAGGGGVGLYIRHRNSRSSVSSASDPQSVAAASDNSGAYGAIDPNTGIPYSLESSGLVGSTMGGGSMGGGGMDAYGGGVSPQQEVQDVVGLVSALQPLLGLGAPAGGQQQQLQAPMDIPAGDSVYDPNTGKFITAPGGQSAAPIQGGGQSAATASRPAPHYEAPVSHAIPLVGRAAEVGHRLSRPYYEAHGGVLVEYGRSGHEVGRGVRMSSAAAARAAAKRKNRR